MLRYSTSLMRLMLVLRPRLMGVLRVLMLASPRVENRQLLMTVRTRVLCASNTIAPRVRVNVMQRDVVMNFHQSRHLLCRVLLRMLQISASMGCYYAREPRLLGSYNP